MTRPATLLLCASALVISAATARAADTFGLQDSDRVAVYHAQGAQIYECRKEPDGALRWAFKEPVAALFEERTPVGVHARGPSWSFSDGSELKAKVVAQAPAASAEDIPHLMLSVTSAQGTSIALARTILRVNTKGGRAPAACHDAGKLLSVPYAADYVFYIAEPPAQ